MWPTQGTRPSGRAGPAPLGARAAVLAGAGIALLLIAVAATAWLSMRAEPAHSPIYANTGSAPAALWALDGSGYSARPAAGVGPASNDADMAFDRNLGRLVLWDHGCTRLVMGFTGGCTTQVDQTWTWDGRSWSAHRQQPGPAAVGPGVMLYSPHLGRVIYVNGVGRAWSWTGAGWSAAALPGAPNIPRRDSALAPSTFAAGYDEGRGQLVWLLSTRTWLWDGATWTSVAGGVDPAEARADAHLVYDAAHRQLVYVGSRSTWTWDGSRWEPHEQPAIQSGTAAFDAGRGAVVLVQPDTSACDATSCRTRTWSWDSRAWTRLALEPAPLLPLTRSGAHALPLAYDDARHAMLLFVSGA